jgi:hypothetical protein
MTETSVSQYITDTFAEVETAENFGYVFFFYRSERKLPFASIAASDNDYDRVSQLDRPGVFRLNIGITRQTFQSLFGAEAVDLSRYDFSALDRIMPHPDYAVQHYVCVLNPSEPTFEQVKPLLAEAYELTRSRFQRANPA